MLVPFDVAKQADAEGKDVYGEINESGKAHVLAEIKKVNSEAEGIPAGLLDIDQCECMLDGDSNSIEFLDSKGNPHVVAMAVEHYDWHVVD